MKDGGGSGCDASSSASMVCNSFSFIFHFSSFLIVGFVFCGHVCYVIVVTSFAPIPQKVGAVIKYCESPKSDPEFRSRFRACACTQVRCTLLRSIYVMRRFRKKGKNRENAKTDQRDKGSLDMRSDVYVLFVPDAPHIREITERWLAGPPHGNLTPPSF